MQFTKAITVLALFVLPAIVSAQSTYLPIGSKEYHFIDRMEIKRSVNSNINYSSTKPYSRKTIVEEMLHIDSARKGTAIVSFDSLTGLTQYAQVTLSKADEYNLNSLLMNSSEWLPSPREEFNSRRPLLKRFYTTKSNFYEVNEKDFFLAVNPMLQLNLGKETDNGQTLYYNSRGLNVRGLIAKKIGFAASITENQERGPSYFFEQVRQRRAVHGYGFYKPFKDTSAVDYFDARGYVTFGATKYINFQIGYDKNFIGNGYRSLFLSDWGNSNLFVKINTKIWRFNYQNLFMELTPQFTKTSDSLYSRKYAAMHHLSINLTKWLNVGLFEGVIFGRRTHYDFQYMNPIIFYRHIEGTVGSPDNAVAGFDFKANIKKRFQVYGQLLLDEFVLKELKNNSSSWVNKFGIQLGAKYIDAFGVDNLDLQFETNRVRPFTYAHNDTVANYTHYNQPLAHPLGANFQEFIGILNYQPLPKLFIRGKLFYYYKGFDPAGMNYGGNIFKDYRTRSGDQGFDVGSGNKFTCLNGILDVAYELRENFFIDASLQQRAFKTEGIPSLNSTMISAGIRVNMAKRTYDY